MRVNQDAIHAFVHSMRKDFGDAENKDNHLIFRGEAKKYESVRSSLLRKFGKVLQCSGGDAADIFRSSLSDRVIAQEASPYLGGGLVSGEEFDALAILQHYGAPTSLIDFSTDWRVALYFACEKSQEQDGCIIFFSREKAGNHYGLRVREPAGHQHDQSGRPVGREIDQKSILVSTESGEFTPSSSDMRKIPRGLKADLLAWLRAQGIHRESVYRDVHGYASLIGDDLLWSSIHIAECAIKMKNPKIAEELLVTQSSKCDLGIEQKGKAFHLLGLAFEDQEKYEDALCSHMESCRLLLYRENGTAPRLAVRRCSKILGRNGLAEEAIDSIDSLW